MKLVYVGRSDDSPTKIIEIKDLKDQDGNVIALPHDPAKNLIIDPHPVYHDRYGWAFNIKIQNSAQLSCLVVTRTDKNEGWRCDDVYFRVYDRKKEDVPPFDSSDDFPYIYKGLNEENPPFDTVVTKVHCTVRTIKRWAFTNCKKMKMCDMTDAPVEKIEDDTFDGCESVTSILFSPVLRKIGWQAFHNCPAIDVLVIPSTVRDIDLHAFEGCRNMRILKLPDAIDLDNVADNIICHCDALLAAVPATKTPKQWLQDRYDQYPLHKVCYNANVTVQEIQHCILEHPNAAFLSDEFDMTALHMITLIACTSNLQSGRDKRGHQQGSTAGGSLIITCFHGNMSAAFAQDDRGKTPLNYLLEYSQLDVHTSLVTYLCECIG